MAVSITAIYEDGVFRPLEKLDLPEHRTFQLMIRPLTEEQLATPEQETLADILGFDPSDEEKLREVAERQHKAIMEIAGTGSSGQRDISSNVDKYLYRKDG